MLRKLGALVLLSAFVFGLASSATAETPPPPPPDRPLRCCDGTLSPSCTCDGPHRGCCSHHKGVCGCAPPS